MNLITQNNFKIFFIIGLMAIFCKVAQSCKSSACERTRPKKANTSDEQQAIPLVNIPQRTNTHPPSPRPQTPLPPPALITERSASPASLRKNKTVRFDEMVNVKTIRTKSSVDSLPPVPLSSVPLSPTDRLPVIPDQETIGESESDKTSPQRYLPIKFLNIRKAFSESLLSTRGIFLNLEHLNENVDMQQRVNKIDKYLSHSKELAKTPEYLKEDAIALSYVALLFLKKWETQILSDGMCSALDSFDFSVPDTYGRDKTALLIQFNREQLQNKAAFLEILKLGHALKNFEMQNGISTRQFAKIMGPLLCKTKEDTFTHEQCNSLGYLIDNYDPCNYAMIMTLLSPD